MGDDYYLLLIVSAKPRPEHCAHPVTSFNEVCTEHINVTFNATDIRVKEIANHSKKYGGS